MQAHRCILNLYVLAYMEVEVTLIRTYSKRQEQYQVPGIGDVYFHFCDLVVCNYGFADLCCRPQLPRRGGKYKTK